jgi:hypothetical protein
MLYIRLLANKKDNIVLITGALGLAGLLWYFWPRAGGELCQPGHHKDPVSGECVPDPVQCQPGYHFDPVTNSCVPDVPVTPQFIGVQNNPNVTGAWAAVTVTVSGGDSFSYTLNIPTSIGDGNHSRSGAVVGGSVSEQFYFPPGTHTITGTRTLNGVTVNDSITFDITQNLNGTFSLIVKSQ